RYLKYDQISTFGNGGSFKLREKIAFFTAEVKRNQLTDKFIFSRSAVQTCIVPGNEKIKGISNELALKGFDVRPILSPTVPSDRERLRFCIHTHNTEEEISKVLKLLKNYIG
ncbi:MAG TPA: hypothetical protein VFM60_04485, partial [Salinimicrobium sp.]|nr:hypothetical protein [Salinimicrobium sp.]